MCPRQLILRGESYTATNRPRNAAMHIDSFSVALVLARLTAEILAGRSTSPAVEPYLLSGFS